MIACVEGEMRQQNRTTTYDGNLRIYTGRVEVCINGIYHSICNIGWDNHDAQVVCNQIYSSRYSKFLATVLSLSVVLSYHTNTTVVGEVYPSFSLPPRSRYIAQDIICNGTESSISQCSYNPPSPECYVGNHSAAVVCRQGTTVWEILSHSCYIAACLGYVLFSEIYIILRKVWSNGSVYKL